MIEASGGEGNPSHPPLLVPIQVLEGDEQFNRSSAIPVLSDQIATPGMASRLIMSALTLRTMPLLVTRNSEVKKSQK